MSFSSVSILPQDLKTSATPRFSALGLGVNADPNIALNIIKTFTASGADGLGFKLVPSITGAVNQSMYGLLIDTDFTKGGSGTHPNLAGLYIDAPVIWSSGGTITNAASLWIIGEPGGAASNLHALRVDSDTALNHIAGFLGIGELNPGYSINVSGTSLTTSGIASQRSSADVNPPTFLGLKSRGTEASKGAALADDICARFTGYGWDGAAWDQIGAVDVIVDVDTGPGTLSGKIKLSTATTAGTLTTAMTIDDGQNLGIGDTTPVGHVEIADAFDPIADLNNSSGGFQLYLRHNVATNNKSAGIGFSVTNADGNCGAAIIHKRTNSQSQGTLNFYTKQSTGAGTDPSLVLSLGDAGEMIFSPGTRNDGLVTQKTQEVTTTDATQTTAATVTLLDENTYHVRATIIGVQSDGANRASYDLRATVYRTAAGSATIQGQTVDHSAESNAAWDATFTVSGNDLRVSVTGAGATTVQWTANLEYTNMSN